MSDRIFTYYLGAGASCWRLPLIKGRINGLSNFYGELEKLKFTEEKFEDHLDYGLK